MMYVLSNAGRAFLRAFAGSLIILAPGVLAAPNLNQTYALGVAALIASIKAGLNVIQVFVPQITLGKWFGAYGKIADNFVQGFLASLIVLLPGVLDAPDLSTAKGLAVAALIGALDAGFRAIQGYFTTGDVPLPSKGLAAPGVK